MTTATLSRLDQIQSTLDEAYTRGWVPTETGKQVKTFPTGMSAQAGIALRELVRAEKAITTLETGFALGLSTLWITGASLATSEDARHVAVDPFQKSDWGNSGKESVKRAGIADVVEHVSQDSLTYLPQLVSTVASTGRTFDFILKSPPASVLLKRAAKLEKGAGAVGHEVVGKVSRAQVEEIAKMKMKDLTAADMDAAVKTIAGSARSMGITVEGV